MEEGCGSVTAMSSPVVSPAELAGLLGQVILVDVRTGADARASYERAHLPSARFVDLETELAVPDDPRHGGRHPLPSPARFAEVLGRLGIGKEDSVVAYDLAGGMNAASRFWWMLRAAGHEDVRVLDAKPEAFAAAGLSMTDAPTEVQPKPPYPFDAYELPTVDADFVERVRRDPTWVVIDVRAQPRYRGETEPIDPIAGHIPGAANLFHVELAGADGRLRAPEEIAARYAEVVGEVPSDHVIVHCGSGVTACHALLAFEHAGLPMPAMYVGSWSEWCRDESRPRATGAGR